MSQSGTARPSSVAELPRPRGAEEEQALVGRFLDGLRRRFDRGPAPERAARLRRAIRHAVHCRRCLAACHIFAASGGLESHRPGVRADVLRRVYFKYLKGGGSLSRWWHGDIELGWEAVSALAEMAYRCNQCGRCAQMCRSSDHAFLAAELRSLFVEMGLAPRQERVRVDPIAVRQRLWEIDRETSHRSGLEVATPWDVEGADLLLVQPPAAGFDWPENVGATALVLTAAGVKWTMASDLCGDVSAQDCFETARQLGAKRLVAGESGPLFADLDDAERAASSQRAHAPESVVSLLQEIVRDGRVAFDPLRNDFPVTLHDPCRLVRRGIVQPQRAVLRRLCPQFREMDPWAEENYCCGGGGGLVGIDGTHDFRVEIAGKKKAEQVLDAFSECLDADTPKYVCAPCGDCRTQFRDLLAAHAPWEKHRILHGGLAELVANAIETVRPGFLQWEWR